MQAIAFLRCDGVCLQITDVHWFLLFSLCSVLSTKLALAKRLVGNCWKGRDVLLGRQSRRSFFKLACLNFKHRAMISVGHLRLGGGEEGLVRWGGKILFWFSLFPPSFSPPPPSPQLGEMEDSLFFTLCFMCLGGVGSCPGNLLGLSNYLTWNTCAGPLWREIHTVS